MGAGRGGFPPAVWAPLRLQPRACPNLEHLPSRATAPPIRARRRGLAAGSSGLASTQSPRRRRYDYDDPPPPGDDALPVPGSLSPGRRVGARRRRPHPPRRVPLPTPAPDFPRLRVSGWSNSSVPRRKPPGGDATRRFACDHERNRIPPPRADCGAGASPRFGIDGSPPGLRPPPPHPRRTGEAAVLLCPASPDGTPNQTPDWAGSRLLPARRASRSGTNESANHGKNPAPEMAENTETILPPLASTPSHS